MVNFASWCRVHDLAPLPAHPETVAQYVAQLANDGLAVSSIRRRLSAIKYAHELAEMDAPTAHKRVRTVLAGIRRTKGAPPARKAPVTAERLATMLGHTSPGLIGLRDRALLSLGFLAALRRSELVALDVADLVDAPDGLRVIIRRSKPDKEGQGHEVAVLTGPNLRAGEAVKAWLAAAGISEGAVFREVKLKEGGTLGGRLSGHAVAEIVKKLASRAGRRGRHHERQGPPPLDGAGDPNPRGARRRDAGGPGPATARAAQQGKPPTAISGSGATTMGRMTRPPAAVRHPNPSKGRVPSFCDQSTVRLPSSFQDLLYHVAAAFLLGTAWTTAWPPASRVRQVLMRTERVAHRSVCGPHSCA